MNLEFFANDGHQYINADRYPNLGFHGVLRRSVKALYSQVLFDPFEEELDLPTHSIDLSDGESGQGKVVCYEDETFRAFGVDVSDSSELLRV